MTTTTQLTISDIADRIGVEPSTVRGYKSRNQMPEPSGYVGRTPYWTVDDDPEGIEAWMKGYRHGASSLKRERSP